MRFRLVWKGWYLFVIKFKKKSKEKRLYFIKTFWILTAEQTLKSLCHKIIKILPSYQFSINQLQITALKKQFAIHYLRTTVLYTVQRKAKNEHEAYLSCTRRRSILLIREIVIGSLMFPFDGFRHLIDPLGTKGQRKEMWIDRWNSGCTSRRRWTNCVAVNYASGWLRASLSCTSELGPTWDRLKAFHRRLYYNLVDRFPFA